MLSGGRPAGHAFPDWAAEREGVAALIKEWDADEDTAVPHEQIAICVPTNQMAAEMAYTLKLHGVDSVEIRSDGPNGSSGVHIGTMFRLKGLEYQRMIIGGVTDGLVPREGVNRLRGTDPVRHRHEIQRARSLLFVAATRARDSVDMFWHGKPSPFLDGVWGAADPAASTT